MTEQPNAQNQITPEEVLAIITGAATDLYKGIKAIQGEYVKAMNRIKELEKKLEKGGKKNAGT